MTKTHSFRTDEEQDKIVERFKNALIRKYRKLHGVWSSEIVGLMENYLKAGGGQNTHTRPAKFTAFHYRLAEIYFALPNSGFFKAPTVDLLIERYAGGHEKTKRAYWNSLRAWRLIILVGPKQYERGLCLDWLREAYELAREREGKA